MTNNISWRDGSTYKEISLARYSHKALKDDMRMLLWLEVLY